MNIKKKVSVVIPCRNEKKYIGECLDSIIKQSYGFENIEVFVSDGMSDDGTTDIVKGYSKKYPQINIINNEKRVAPVAMNLGIKKAAGDIIIIFGAHAYMDEDYVKYCVQSLEDENIACVGGKIINISENESAEAISFAMGSPFGVGNALFRYSDKEELVDTVAFGAYRKEVFENIGYFDEEFVRNQDDELNFRLTKSGAKILLNPSILSKYYTRGSFSKLWRQYFQYGFWKVRVIQKHKKPASMRHLVPMAFVIALIGGIILSPFFRIIRYLFLAMIMCYFCGAIYFAAKAVKGNSKHIFRVAYSFLILHISYGLGFLDGIWAFFITKNGNKVDKNTRMSR